MALKTTAALAASTALLLPSAVLAQGGPPTREGWSFSAGAGLFTSPTYLGDDENQLSLFPDLRVSYGERFEASVREASFTLIDGDGLTLGVAAGLDFGRDEDGSNPFTISGGDSTDLIGLGEVDSGVELGGFGAYQFGPLQARLSLRQSVSGHEGLVGDASVRMRLPLMMFGRRGFAAIGPEVSFGDEDFTNAYFGVTPDQSLASGLPEYEAEGGLTSYGVGVVARFPLNDDTSFLAFGGVDQLAGDAADAPLVQERGSETQASFGLFLSRRF